jgi:tetratricopeptide (TPR) repeat protein
VRSSRSGARRLGASWRAAVLVAVLALPRPAHAQTQTQESPEVLRALELENAGKFREAAPLYRAAISRHPTPIAVLGLERSYAELGMSDSLLAPLDSVLTRYPREPIYHVVHLRTYQLLHREDGMRAAFERWVRDVPRDAAPYGEYARVLLEQGRPASADSIIERGREALGSGRDLQYQTAQLRAAQGEWEPSAKAWRAVLAADASLASAAAYSLAPAPAATRGAIREILSAAPPDPGARRALADLDVAWGQPQSAWEALRTLPPDSAAASVWQDFGERAMADERYALAREALAAAVHVHRTPELALAAAKASLRAGFPAEAGALAPLGDAGSEPQRTVTDYLPLHLEALAALGRGADAAALFARWDQRLTPGQHSRMARLVASAWVHAGDLERARTALRSAGEDADSSDAAALIALYEGRLGVARGLLRGSRDQSAEMALVLGLVSRVRGDSAPELGAGFLALARGDSATAAQRFVDAAAQHADAASALLLAAARIPAARGYTPHAAATGPRLVADHGDAPEAAEAELEWARTLRRRGDLQGAITHLEHLILSAPESALLPQARRELELARGTVPPG